MTKQQEMSRRLSRWPMTVRPPKMEKIKNNNNNKMMMKKMMHGPSLSSAGEHPLMI
jgi:hypothetical protein